MEGTTRDTTQRQQAPIIVINNNINIVNNNSNKIDWVDVIKDILQSPEKEKIIFILIIICFIIITLSILFFARTIFELV